MNAHKLSMNFIINNFRAKMYIVPLIYKNIRTITKV